MQAETSQHSADLFRLLVENVRDFAVFMTDLDGRVLGWNPGVENLLGFAEGEWVGQHASVIFTPEDRERRAPELEMETALAEGRAEDRRWHLRKGGSRFWADGLLMLLRDGAGRPQGFAKILRDNTEAKLTEERLRESEERFELLVELSPDAIAVHAEGVVLFMNTAGARLLRAEGPEQIVGRSIAELIHPDYHGIIRERIEKASRGEASPPAEIRFIRLDGTELYGELASAPLIYQGKPALQAVVRDLTRRRQSEQALRQREEQFRTLADSIPQLAWMAEADGHIFWYNRRWFEYTGTTLEEMEGWGWRKVHDPEALPRVIERWTDSIRTGEPFEMSFPLRGADGAYRRFLTRVLPLRDAAGRVVRWFGTNTDIEEQLRAEEALQEANRLKDEFLATLSHELRTPLTAILGWSNMLRGGRLDEDTAARALDAIERNARSQVQLIDDLLDVSRIITGKLRLDVRPVELSHVVEAAAESVRPAAEAKGIRLQVLLDTQAGPVSGDTDRLQQVVWNLLTNAVKFTPEGGRVQVRMERVDSHVEVAVSDTGRGIGPEFLPHVFERFRQADQTTSRAHGGLGLGLSIVRQLVELHGGSVRAESEGKGRGATFVVRLPLLVAHRQPETHERRQRAAGTAGPLDCPPQLDGLRVLVVDDEQDARELLGAVLGQCGSEVTTAGSAAEALELFARSKPDVLVSDIGMPGEDGYELIGKVRALERERGGDRVPAVAVTAYARVEDRVRALNAGYQAHVPKPVEPAELAAVVASLAGRTGPPD